MTDRFKEALLEVCANHSRLIRALTMITLRSIEHGQKEDKELRAQLESERVATIQLAELGSWDVDSSKPDDADTVPRKGCADDRGNGSTDSVLDTLSGLHVTMCDCVDTIVGVLDRLEDPSRGSPDEQLKCVRVRDSSGELKRVRVPYSNEYRWASKR